MRTTRASGDYVRPTSSHSSPTPRHSRSPIWTSAKGFTSSWQRSSGTLLGWGCLEGVHTTRTEQQRVERGEIKRLTSNDRALRDSKEQSRCAQLDVLPSSQVLRQPQHQSPPTGGKQTTITGPLKVFGDGRVRAVPLRWLVLIADGGYTITLEFDDGETNSAQISKRVLAKLSLTVITSASAEFVRVHS